VLIVKGVLVINGVDVFVGVGCWVLVGVALGIAAWVNARPAWTVWATWVMTAFGSIVGVGGTADPQEDNRIVPNRKNPMNRYF
jgi:hypothetical protein